MVERDLAKVEVAGSSPVIRSIITGLFRQARDFFPKALRKPKTEYGAIAKW